MDAIRGIGVITVLLGAAGVLTRFGRSFKLYPSSYPKMQSFWRWSGRIGVALLAVGAVLVLVSTLWPATRATSCAVERDRANLV